MLYHSLVAAALLSPALAAPAPTKVSKRQQGGGNVGGNAVLLPTETAAGPQGATGQQRGPKSLAGYSPSNSFDTEDDTVIPSSQYQLAPDQTKDADLGLYLDLSTVENPQPIRGQQDSPTDPGPRDMEIERQNSDLYAPPGTDSGDVDNAKWPLGLSHNRHGMKGSGFARQQNTGQLPVATAMAGVVRFYPASPSIHIPMLTLDF